ncbi:MAG: LLM class flavin-dependent oxidoreductase [Crocinitomicaceae bacterium TMED135]|nr:MAG: LLM class flavin-dependent oxidoreductase [Crocinitomicaceae bacterium TMED135]
MQIGIDSFAAAENSDSFNGKKNAQSIEKLINRIVKADQVGLDVFGVGEHHRREFLDSAPHLILSAASAKTKNIILTSAVTVLSAADPVRVFQNYATLDLISNGRAEIIAGRGSFTEAFELFGYDLNDYDQLFEEKLELLIKIQNNDTVNWMGKYRPDINNQTIFPRPVQNPLPIWIGVGGTPQSFIRAGKLGLPLMIAVIGGETHRFKPLVDMYRESGRRAGHSSKKLKVGLHSLGYVAENSKKAVEDYFPGYAKTFTRIGKERGWPPVTLERFKAQNGPLGALMIGSTEEIAEKILRHSEALGGISRFTFQMDNAELSHKQLLKSIELIGEKIRPIIN